MDSPMPAVVTALVVALVPFATMLALLWLADRVQRAREEVRLRQIAITDAIHWRIGALVSPVVRKRPWGPWQVLIPPPLARPDVVGTVLATVQQAFRGIDPRAAEHLRVVFTPQA